MIVTTEKSLEKHIAEIYEYLFRKELWNSEQYKIFVRIFRKLVFAFKHCSNEKEIDELEHELIDVKCKNGICVICGAGRLLACRCRRCKTCKCIPETCFCSL